MTEPRKAVVALKWTVREMENRYRAMSKLGVRNIEGFNQRLAEADAKGETLMRRVQTGFDEDGRRVFDWMLDAAAPRNLDGITLEMIVTQLQEYIGWEAMAAAVPIRGLIPGMALHFAGCCHPLPIPNLYHILAD